MAHFLFLDESGQDHRESPYEVLAGVVVEDRDLWNLVRAVQDSEIRHFGMRYSSGHNELKSKKLLRAKTFRLAGQMPRFSDEERRRLAQACLQSGQSAGMPEITALAQAKLAYVRDVLDICAQHHCRAIATILTTDVPGSLPTDMLRRDYCYLLERFFYLLEDCDPNSMGIVVFDELEKSMSHLLVEQMDRYFKLTAKGRQRAGRIVPEPFFVHSDLTTGVQLADLAAYVLSWGFRKARGLTKPAREELGPLVDQVCRMRFRVNRDVGPEQVSRFIWSFVVVGELRGECLDE